MSDEARTATEVKEERKEPVVPERGQVGANPVGPVGIVLITAYLILLSIILLHGLVQFWSPLVSTEPSPVPAEPTPVPAKPTRIPAEESATTISLVTFLFWEFAISDEVRLLLIVALAGALGSLVHALRSLYWYVGNRALVRNWLAKYILLPFVGSTLALVFYFVFRGGLFSPQTTVQQTSPFGFAALAGLVRMFSDQAAEKPREVAATLLAPTPKGADHVPPKTEEESGANAKPQERG